MRFLTEIRAKERHTSSFCVDDMTCGHCTAVITQALQTIDPSARIRVNLATHQVDIDSPTKDVSRLHSAISNAGYAAVLIGKAVATADRSAKVKSTCCCG